MANNRDIHRSDKNFLNLKSNNKLMEENIENIFESPAVKLCQNIIEDAVKMYASDIHIEPIERDVRIRYRLNGELKDILHTSKEIYRSLVARIKILGDMDISEKRMPQDGRILFHVDDRDVDLRISSIPTILGEKIVIRLLDSKNQISDIKKIGLGKEDILIIQKILKKQSGLFLVTGPTGSGKSTTLNSIINALNNEKYNIVTIEEPVEYLTYGVNQINVNSSVGIDFSLGLRAILRQDPDIIMIGEIRDKETAEIAIRAAITGHLVLSTMHTGDAISSYMRLIDMGVEPYLLTSSICCILSQRLIKKLCPDCKTFYEPGGYEKKILKQENNSMVLYKESGCPNCNYTGYISRIGIFELLIPDNEVKKSLNMKPDYEFLKDLCISKGMRTLEQSCRQLVIQGICTFDEIIKVIYMDN